MIKDFPIARVSILMALFAAVAALGYTEHMWGWWLALLAVPLAPIDAWLARRRRKARD